MTPHRTAVVALVALACAAAFAPPTGLGAPRIVRRLAAAAATDANALSTQLARAVEREDYAEAARLRDALEAAAPDLVGGWETLGAVPWLAERCGDLTFAFPTPVQAAALKAAAAAAPTQADLVVRAPTGSGKTLAALVPALSGLSADLLARQDATCVTAPATATPLLLRPRACTTTPTSPPLPLLLRLTHSLASLSGTPSSRGLSPTTPPTSST